MITIKMKTQLKTSSQNAVNALLNNKDIQSKKLQLP
jgi:hypothetical protein